MNGPDSKEPLAPCFQAPVSGETWKPPSLLPADVHELVVMIDVIARTPGFDVAQKNALRSIKARLLEGGTPPNVCAALCDWFHALNVGTKDMAIATGNALLECMVASGEFSRWVPLSRAMEALYGTLMSLRLGRPMPVPPGGACYCGWPFPLTVSPLPASRTMSEYGAADIEERRLKDAAVAMRCPTCGELHCFMAPDTAERFPCAPEGKPS